MINGPLLKNRRRPVRRFAERGFTLIEMLVVISIIGLIMALVGPRVLNFLSQSKVKAAKIQIESLTSALDLYVLDTGQYPSNSEGLEALMQRPGSCHELGWALFERQCRFPKIRGESHTSITRRASTERTTSCPMARMDKKAALVQQPISPTGPNDGGPKRRDSRSLRSCVSSPLWPFLLACSCLRCRAARPGPGLRLMRWTRRPCSKPIACRRAATDTNCD